MWPWLAADWLAPAHCSRRSIAAVPWAPPPPPREGPAQDSRESGRAWGEPSSGCRAPRGGGPGPRGGSARRGTTGAPAAAPGFPRRPGATRAVVILCRPPLPPMADCRRPVIALKGFPAGAHLWGVCVCWGELTMLPSPKLLTPPW